MKKQLLVLISLLALAGCGSTETPTPSTPTPSNPSGETTNTNHQGPASYYDPQAVDLTKEEVAINNLSDDFYDTTKWEAFSDGDHFAAPEIQTSGAMKFRNTNAAFNLGDYSNKSFSMSVRGNNDWQMWLLSSNKANSGGHHIKLECQYNVLRIKTSFSGVSAVAYVPAGYNFKMDQYNRLDFKFETVNNVTTMKLWIDCVPVKMKKATDFSKQGVSIKDGNLVLQQSSSYQLGNYMLVKIWDDEDFLFIKKA